MGTSRPRMEAFAVRPSISNTGSSFPSPNGAREFTAFSRSRFTSPREIRAAMSRVGVAAVVPAWRRHAAEKAARNAASWSRVMLSPAALSWPPKASRYSAHSASAAWTSYPGGPRTEPRPMSPPGENATRAAGRHRRSAAWAAASPTTPWCHPSPAPTKAPSFSLSKMSGDAICAAAASSTFAHSPLRRAFVCFRRMAKARASSCSWAISSSKAREASAMRPAELM